MLEVLPAALLFVAALWVTAVLAIRRQRLVLGLGEAPFWMPLRTLRWSGALLAGVLGPLLFAKLLVTVLAVGSEVLLPTAGAGMMAGVGGAWLLLPMALLVIGTAALKLAAAAHDLKLDTRDVIRLADGNEWSLMPLGFVLACGVMLLLAGAAGLLVDAAMLLLLPLGAAVLVWGSGRLALRYQALGGV